MGDRRRDSRPFATAPFARPLRQLAALSPILALGGCDGVQSALSPAGVEAERVAGLFWFMLAGAVVVWLLVVGTTVYATQVRPGPHRKALARWFLLGGGVAFPVILLGLLLGYGLNLMSELRPEGDGLRVTVSGEQWWWRVAYHPAAGADSIVAANEIRLPVGRRIELSVESPDVIHSFWIPALAGKMDMIPGRSNRLVLEPTRIGDFRGACAEYCGTSHTLMAFTVKVMEQAGFDTWLARQAAPSSAPESPGAALFRDVGCGGCHAIRGTAAAGTIGPDLTHLASRPTLGAGTLEMSEAAIARFVADPAAVKPGALMPAFAVLGEARIAALAAYLASLE